MARTLTTTIKHLCFRFCAIGLSLCGCLALAEIAFRLIIPEKEQAHTPVYTLSSSYRLPFYDLQPSGKGAIYGKEFTINSSGIRGEEISRQKSAVSERRIGFLGDSMIFGYGVGDHETVPYLLEAALRQQYPAYRVLNFGVWGYGFVQYPAVFEKKARCFDLDALVLQTYINDVSIPENLFVNPPNEGRNQAGQEAQVVQQGWEAIPQEGDRSKPLMMLRSSYLALRQHLLFVQYLDPRIKHLAYNSLKAFHLEKCYMLAQGFSDIDSYINRDQQWEAAQRALEELQRQCQAEQIAFAVVIYPAMTNLDKRYGYAAYHEALGAFFRRHDVLYLDLREALPERNLSKFHLNLLDQHPDERFNQMITPLIRDFLEANGLVE